MDSIRLGGKITYSVRLAQPQRPHPKMCPGQKVLKIGEGFVKKIAPLKLTILAPLQKKHFPGYFLCAYKIIDWLLWAFFALSDDTALKGQSGL